ncbi:MAG: GH92 family glycosyl hydrolase [Edaphobacter sp.]|uniref:GH92 family glycosyl hydrolase n=1 Tax=Edaphobacter sp. TaxID=1934404 RepID=UPI0023A47083|nr:GH92 family glycosyl hydrolase [Edaphobacter sp.]MDE1176766.1 GH92 family glycosyl hydrolase [Edaphobacter sp.]
MRTLLRCLPALLVSATAFSQTPYQLVDPYIGTANEGQTAPLVGEPFAMTQFTPETQPTEKKCVSPYYFADTKLTGFRASHWLSGSCIQEYGSLTVMPTMGELKPQPQDRAAAFAHSDEVAQPAFYSVKLPAYDETVEMTAGIRAGMIRVNYGKAGEANLVIEPNARMKDGWVKVDLAKKEITGYNPVYRVYQGSGKPAGFKGYFVIQFRDQAESAGTWCDAKASSDMELSGEGKCEHMGAYLRFKLGAPHSVVVKVGSSFTSIDEARANLRSEIPAWDFAALKAKTTKRWEGVLNEIVVGGGTTAERHSFYTALYHSMLGPRIVSDADGSYPRFGGSGKVEKSATPYYDDFSMWDIYRAQLPLLTLVEPHRYEAMMQSLVLKGEQGGYLPIFPAWSSYTSEMIGDHTGVAMTDAYMKGLRNFDLASAWKLVRQNAFDTPPYEQYKDGLGRRALQSYMKYGYIPLEDPVNEAFHQKEQVSRTLEYAFDDTIIARFADALGHKEDAAVLAKRGSNWKNVIDPETKLARGRHQDGSWITPFEPNKWASFVTESNPYQYTFYVPQDVAGLMQTLGGREKFVASLDGLFEKKLYDPGNEPGHHIAYLYDEAGAAWKTQKQVAELVDVYNDTPKGIPGNDDAGQMSAWWIFSTLGFYPVAPGIPEYWIGTPRFPSATMTLPGGKKFTVIAKNASATNCYIQTAKLNGVTMKTARLQHADIVKGGTLEFVMGAEPNKSLFQ